MDEDNNTECPSVPCGMNGQNLSPEISRFPLTSGNQSGEDGDGHGDNEDFSKDLKKGRNAEEEVYDDEDDDDGGNGVQRIGIDEYEDSDENVDDDDCGGLPRHSKKRKLKQLASSYELVPRGQASASAAGSALKPSYGGRNPLTDWTEHETFILLDAWGDRYLKRGRKSLRSEEWREVSEMVSQESKIKRTDTQCRNRLDTLKKAYKKEKLKLEDSGESTSKWACFEKMDVLLSSTRQTAGLSCGLNSGEHVFINSKADLNRSNELDETSDSPGNAVSTEGAEDKSDHLRPNNKKKKGRVKQAASFKYLADSIHKFVDIYEKIENSKRQQVLELEKIRMDFQRDMELQKRLIFESTQAEIAKIRRGNNEDNNASTGNASG